MRRLARLSPTQIINPCPLGGTRPQRIPIDLEIHSRDRSSSYHHSPAFVYFYDGSLLIFIIKTSSAGVCCVLPARSFFALLLLSVSSPRSTNKIVTRVRSSKVHKKTVTDQIDKMSLMSASTITTLVSLSLSLSSSRAVRLN
jgi:hypothetical protein